MHQKKGGFAGRESDLIAGNVSGFRAQRSATGRNAHSHGLPLIGRGGSMAGMACLVCRERNEVGALCRACSQKLSAPADLICEHLWSNVEDADAWLVDKFGAPHRLGAVSVIGRDHDHEMVVLSNSVSREHAEIKKTGTTWTIRDLGSRNSTYVDNVKTQGRLQLPERCIVKVGDVTMWFLQQVAEEPAPTDSLATEELANEVVCMRLDAPRVMLRAVGNSDAGSGGTLMSQAPDATEWVNYKLTPIEFQLLRILFVRAMAEAGSPAEVKGCVPTRQLVRDLPWKSDYPDEENVRALVKRLRKVLSEAGANGILDVEPGRGYYFSCPVSLG
jgi:hypothetical protein